MLYRNPTHWINSFGLEPDEESVSWLKHHLGSGEKANPFHTPEGSSPPPLHWISSYPYRAEILF